ncbi:hypothetical protein SLS63_012696 [Diaporthe eres]|uniref:Major facilitator superfamily transporter n=1 Tax=Diaporthe eres TaxID=83184 RepID=A0ABR1NQP1_DIAER
MAPRPSSVPDNQSDRDGIDAEKGSSQLQEHIQQSGNLAPEDAEFLAHFTDAQRKRVLGKVDWRLVPMLLILYLISFIDRANIGNAKIEGLLPSLGMSGTEYNIALAVFFIPYTLAEVPSNALLNKFERPSTFMGIIVTIWGIVMMCTGFVHNFAGLCVSRIFLGLFEWLDPDEIRYLELRQIAAGRVKPQGTKKEKSFDMKIFVSVLCDLKIYLLIVAFWSNVTPNYGLKFTMPQVLKNMGYTSSNAQLMTVPAYCVGALAAYGFSVISDRVNWRMPTIVVPQLCVLTAYAILFAKAADIKDNIPACYFAICLACFGLYPIGPGVQAWNMSNLAGPAKRAMGIGWMTGVGNMGGITGSFIFLDREAPTYPTGFGSSLGFAAAGAVACLLLELMLFRSNKKNEGLSEEEVRAQFSDEDLERLGDKSPLFKYTL